MRLVLDLQATQSATHFERGITRYVAELTLALVDIGADIALLALNPDLPLPPSLPPRLLAHPNVKWASAAGIESVVGDAVYLATSPMHKVPARSVLPEPVRRRELPLLAILYDLIPLVYPERYLRENVWSEAVYRQRLEVYGTVDMVLAISEHSRLDGIGLLGLDPNRVHVIHGGVSAFFHPAPASAAPPALLGLDRPYVLSIGGDDPRKNLDGLVRAWSTMSRRHHEELQLVIACNLGEGTQRALLDQARQAGAPDGSVLLTGYVDDLSLRQLYQHAALCVAPSRYEGLGLPVLESLACGCPVVTSSTSSLPEVLELPSSTFDPEDPKDMAAAMNRGLEDQDLRAEILSRGAARLPRYSWTATAERVLAAAERLRRPARTTAPARRPVVAIVGPVPPSPAGPAVYTGRIARSLVADAEADFDVLLVDTENRRCSTVDDVRCVPVGAFGELVRHEELHHVVTVFGNSEHYAEGMELHRRHPSVAWLHEARLAAIVTTRARRLGIPAEAVLDEARRLYADRVPVLPLGEWLDPGRLSALGVGFTDLAVRNATALLVHSELALRLVQLDQRGRPLPPTAVLPLAFLDPVALPEAEPDEPPLVVALGIVSSVKAPDVLLGAVARLRRHVDVRLAFVGPEGVTGTVVRARADAMGIGTAVTVTGELDEETYRAWMRRASVGVQLRRTSYGESSAAVADLLSCGVPCVTSVATAAEMPPGVVQLVPPEVGSEQLADVLAELLDDPRRRESLAAAGRALASRWTHHHVAMALLPTLEELASAARGTVLRPGPVGG